MTVSGIFIRRPIATSLLTLAILLVGLLAFFHLPIAPLPQIDYPTISVSASLPGASPETMAATIATPLERVLGSIAGVTEITSTSTLGQTRITLQFDLRQDIDGAARSVQAAINAARNQLPSGMPNKPSYRKVNPSDAPIMLLALTSDTLSPSQMYDAASTILVPALAQVDGVGDVALSGSSLPAVRIELDPIKLAAQGLALDQVRQALLQANSHQPTGFLETHQQTWQIGTPTQVLKASDYAPLIISYRQGTAVRLSDIATVKDSVQDSRAYGLANGQPAILVILQKAPGANIIRTVEQIQALLPHLQAALPGAMDMRVMMERTRTIRASLHEVEITLLVAVVLVVLVVYAFLRDWRATFIPAINIPTSLAGTCGVMYLLGYSIDNLSLMAMTIATGFIVDDAIVVLENIQRHLDKGVNPWQAAQAGVQEIGFTVLAISVALIAAFIPILWMDGIVGRLLREFAVVLTVTIVISMVVSLTTTPMLTAWLLQRPAQARAAQPAAVARARFSLGRALKQSYRHSLRWALRQQPFILCVLAVVIGLNVYLYRTINKSFFPQQDTGRIMGMVQADQASSFQSMKTKLDAYMQIIRQDPAVANVTGFVGGNQRSGANLFIALKPLSVRRVAADRVIARLRPKLAQVAGASLYLRSTQDIRLGSRPSAAEYQYTLQADELAELQAWEPRITDALSQLPELKDVNSDQQNGAPQTTLVIDRDKAARLGLSVKDIDETLNNAFGQRQISTIYNALNQYRVILELAPAYQRNPEALNALYFTTAQGQSIPLSAFASLQPTLAPPSVNHQKSTPAATISFNLAPGTSLSEATQAIQRTIRDLGLPIAIRASFEGSANAFQASLQNQPWLILAALITIYLVLGILYESLLHPLTILSTLPSAGIGALLALMAFKTDLSIIAMIGIVLLIGMVKKNAILMIDFALHQQRQAQSREATLSATQAIYSAARLRLRPILMTTLAALFGAVPLLLTSGEGAEFRQPLGMAIVGGLIFSQLLTLYTTPVTFAVLSQLKLKLTQLRHYLLAAKS